MGVSVGSSIYNAPSIYESGAGGVNFDGYVTIEGESYPYKRINNRIWTLENLRNTNNINFSSILTTSFDQSYVYPISKDSNDFNLLKITGALYNYIAVKYIAQNYNLEGFRIPSIDDFLDLKKISCPDLKSFKTWANDSGKDKYNFCAIATGYVNSNNIVNQSHTTDFWTSDHKDSSQQASNFWFGETQSEIIQELNGYDNGFCIRLCKDM